MSKHFSIEGAEDHILSAVKAKDEFEKIGVGIVELLQINHVVMQWVLGQGSDAAIKKMMGVGSATKENISMLDGLWGMCANHGIQLDEAQKIELYQDFLDD